MDPAAAENVKLLSRMRALRDTEAKGGSEIQQLYNGSVVFITGGTGFLGKQLIEKLLRACHGIKKIYLLIRSKKGKPKEERLTKLCQNSVFDELRKTNPEFEKLIVPVDGDMMELKLGIKQEDWEKLTQEVNFIYHVAATVLFNEPIKSAIIANVRGTREVLHLARQCQHLKSVVHVSTAYCHCYMQKVEEKFYPVAVRPETIIEMVESMEETRLDAMTEALIEGWPNTYTFSKAIAEELVREMGEGLPICVVRPAMVLPTHREPEAGWMDKSNVYGASGIYLGSCIGALRVVYMDWNCHADLVPVDYVNNLVIASSWETVRKFQRGEQDIKIYTCSRIRNRLSNGRFVEITRNECRKFMSPKVIWHPDSIITENKHIFLFLTVILHFIPALFIDGILMAMGKKLRVSKIYQKVYNLNRVLCYFLLKDWDFIDDNTVDLSKKLSKADKLIFHFDVADLEHVPFMIIWALGLRKYLIRDGLTGTEKAVKRQHIVRVLHYTVSALYFFFLWKVLTWAFSAFIFCATCVLQFVRYAK